MTYWNSLVSFTTVKWSCKRLTTRDVNRPSPFDTLRIDFVNSSVRKGYGLHDESSNVVLKSDETLHHSYHPHSTNL